MKEEPILIEDLAEMMLNIKEGETIKINTVAEGNGLNFWIAKTEICGRKPTVMFAPDCNENAFTVDDTEEDRHLTERLENFFLSLEEEFIPDNNTVYLTSHKR